MNKEGIASPVFLVSAARGRSRAGADPLPADQERAVREKPDRRHRLTPSPTGPQRFFGRPASRPHGLWHHLPTMRVLLTLALLAATVCAQGAEEFRVRSRLLSKFWRRAVYIEAGVVVPPKRDRRKKLPTCFNIHGFGGSHRVAWNVASRLQSKMEKGDYPRMIYVYLNAQFAQGHHEFADSANNGPWGKALTTEFIPALEKKFKADPEGRFLTGHSSGGWSSFWLQVTYPDFFAGTWSTAPDSMDFRDFTGVNIYEFKSVYVDPAGEDIPLMRQGSRWAMTIRQFVRNEERRGRQGGQFQSFDAVFSPRGRKRRPKPMFDRKTGEIDPKVAKAWEKYDIGLILRRDWKTLGPKLKGKLHAYCGTQDTFRLEGALRLIKKDLADLGSDAEIVLVEGRNHGSLMHPHPELWPNGLIDYIHRAMWKRWQG
jgi:pimeloyl-ACP methyl ester carboxylesterase